MNHLKTISIILLAFACISCRKGVKNTNQSLDLDIPVNEHGDSSHLFKVVKQFESQMTLTNMQITSDSMGIRVWQIPTLFPYKRMVQIRRLDSNWIGEVYLFRIGEVELNIQNERRYKIGQFDSSTIYPKSGWLRFMDTLYLLGIQTLPTMDSIPDFEDTVLDGTNYCVEVNTKNFYRFYDYHSPCAFLDYEDVRMMCKIIQFMNSVFDLDSLEDNYWTSGNMTND